jgi:hypothetical protein
MVKIRVRSGASEAEIEADLSHIREAIELIPEIVSKLPIDAKPQDQSHDNIKSTANLIAETSTSDNLPVITIEKGDSLSDVVSKFFSSSWGKNPKKLSEVREALQSYGLNYPKQSVAVALLRLAKSSKIRRFKSNSGEFVYTTSIFSPAVSQSLITENANEIVSTVNI